MHKRLLEMLYFAAISDRKLVSPRVENSDE